MSLNRGKSLDAQGVKKKKKQHIYKGSTGDNLAQDQAGGNKRSYMTDQAKRKESRAKATAGAEADKAKLKAQQLMAKQEAAKKSQTMGATKEGAEAASMGASIQGMKDKKALEEADKKIAATKKVGDFDKGRDRAIEILGEEGLGRLGEDKDIQETMEETKQFRKKQEEVTGLAKEQLTRQQGLTGRYEKMADEGIDSSVQEAMRSKMAQQMSQAAQMAGLKAGSAMGGMRGASSGAQARSMMGQAMGQRAGIERDIFLESEAAKERGLKGMSGALQAEQGAIAGIGAGVAGERAALGDYRQALGQVKTFDIGQAAAEKELIGSMGMQYEQLAQADRAAKMAADAQIKAGKAQCFLPGTLISMSDGTAKKIEDLLPGDTIKHGGNVEVVGKALQQVFFSWNDILLGQGHCVKEVNGWVDVDYADSSTKVVLSKPTTVYNIVCENNKMQVAGKEDFLVGDYISATDKSIWSKIYVPYKKLKRGVSEVISSIFKSNVNGECNG